VHAAHQTHKIHVHLALGILDRSVLQWPAYSHSGVVDENVNAALSLDNLIHGGLHLSLILDVSLYVGDTGDEFLGIAVGTINGMARCTELSGHSFSKSGGDSGNEDYHIVTLLLLLV
jgi:hypothetical protein